MDTMAEISFDTIGVKKLNTSFAPITKIDS
jgi:hypothetical protein